MNVLAQSNRASTEVAVDAVACCYLTFVAVCPPGPRKDFRSFAAKNWPRARAHVGRCTFTRTWTSPSHCLQLVFFNDTARTHQRTKPELPVMSKPMPEHAQSASNPHETSDFAGLKELFLPSL